MFRNSQKISIGKHFFISLLFIVLLFTSFGMAIDDTYASDLNQSMDGMESELNIGDKLGNSHENSLSINLEESDLLSVNQEKGVGEILSAPAKGGTFNDIRKMIVSAHNGDTITLEGTYVAEKKYDSITLNKRLKFTSTTGATLDGKGSSYIFVLEEGSAYSSFKNIKFMNGNRNGLGGAMYININDITITNCEFEKNTAVNGGAIYSAYDPNIARNLLIQNCKFTNNHATRSAAAVAAFGENSRIFNCTFESNGAYNDQGTALVPYGGAIQIGLDKYSTKGYVYDCKFYNNFVDPVNSYAHGGAGCIRDGIEYKNCIFVNNSASQGGALTFHASGSIKNCTFINNTARYFGGALSTGYADSYMILDVSDCNFDGNSAPIGGAIQANGLNINVQNSNFNYNNASKNGGAININAENVFIDESNFNGNTANIDGGAVFINGKNTLITSSSFISNDAMPDVEKLDDGLGGAIYVNSTQATIENNEFYYNTARNGSAIYYDKYGTKLNLTNNTLYKNQAWVYSLPIYAEDIYYGQSEEIGSIIHGGNNIGKYGDLSVSNAIYTAANNNFIELDGENPVKGATESGHLYQDDREYNMDILMTVVHEDGTVVYNKTLNSDCFGEVSDSLNNLKVGNYFVTAKHFEDDYYKAITNTTTFSVTAQIDNKVRKSVNDDDINYLDVVVWTLTIVNNGPSNATSVVVKDILPEGLVYLDDDTGGEYDNETGVLTFDFLEVGKPVVVNIRTIVEKTGLIVNNVNVTAKEYDYNLTNNNDTSSINVNSACDLAIEKSINASVANISDLVKWTITVTNNGPDTATGVHVSDLLPKSLIFKKSNGNYNPDTGIWDIGTLKKGDSVSLDITCLVNATGLIENEASVKGNEYDYDETNNHASEIVRVNSASDLAIVKVVSPGVVNYTDVVKWTLVVSNLGPDPASGVKIYDALPEGFVYLNSTLDFVGDVIDVGDLGVGDEVSIDIYCWANVTGNFVNVASVSGNEHDPNPANNDDDATILVKPASDLAVVKDVNESNPNYGDLVKWTITVTNNGPDNATGVVVSDLLPASMIFKKSNGNYNPNTGIWDIGSLNEGDSISLDIVCMVNATGLIENHASVSGNEFDFNKSNNYDWEAIEVDSASDLAIVKLVSPAVVNYTDVVKWTLVVSNLGPDPASGVKIYDALPEGFVYLNSTLDFVGDVIDVGDLGVGDEVSIDVYCWANVTGSFVNVASVRGNEHDSNPANNKDNASVFVKPAADLAVIKDVNNTNPNYGDLVKWIITVTNNGPNDATGVVVSDLLPESLIFKKSNGNYDSKTGIWNVGSLNKGEIKTLEIITQVNATGISRNHVSVSGNEFDHNKSNNMDNKPINVSNAADLSVVKFANVSQTDYHETVKWTIIAYNNGPDKATGVVVDDILPNGLVLLDYNASKGFYDNGMWSVCCIESGQNETLELICYVNVTGDVTNFVRIGGEEYDPDKSNNDDDSTIYVPQSSDLSVVKTVDNPHPNYGDIIEWSIVLTNNGPDIATDISVVDMLPDGLELIDYNSSKGSYGDGIWYVNNLGVGCSESIIIRCFIKTLDDITNVAEVIPSQYDWNMSNNKDDSSITASPLTDLAIIKTIDVSQANYLEVVTWTLLVTNYGPNDATGVVVGDVMPEGLEIIGANGDGEYEGSIWNVGDLKNGESKKLDIACKILATGSFTNIANVWGDQTDPDLTNNEDESNLDVNPASDISVTKTVSKYRYSVGDLVSYSIKLTNNGPDKAINVEVNEIMDDSLTLRSFMASAGDFDKLNEIWSIDVLDVGESAFLKIKAAANKVGVAKNSVSATNDNYDPDLTNNEDEVTVNVTDDYVKDNIPTKNSPVEKSNDFGESILEKNKSGNPLIAIALLIVFSMGIFCGSNIFKRR